MGKTKEAHQIGKLESRLDDGKTFPLWPFARIYAYQGDRDQALEYLAENAKKGFNDGNQDFILIDPFYESLRDDPKLQAIVKKAQ